MKKSLKLGAIAFAFASILTGCKATYPVAATSNPVGNKCGTATSTKILGFGGSDNLGINAAAKNGGITRISHVDYSTYSVLGIYTKVTTRVYGE